MKLLICQLIGNSHTQHHHPSAEAVSHSIAGISPCPSRGAPGISLVPGPGPPRCAIRTSLALPGTSCLNPPLVQINSSQMGSDNPPHARSHELKQFQPARGQRQNLSEQEQREQREFEGRDSETACAQQLNKHRLRLKQDFRRGWNSSATNAWLMPALSAGSGPPWLSRQAFARTVAPGPVHLAQGKASFAMRKALRAAWIKPMSNRAARSRRHCCQRAFVAECPAVRVQTRTMKTVATPLA